MEFRLLGPLQVTIGGREVRIASGKHRAILATLLLRANESVPIDELIGRVWDVDGPSDARSTIHTYVRRLRQALGEAGGVIRTRPDGYAIELVPDQLDLTVFTGLLDRAVATLDTNEERALLTDALNLWRGPALTGVPSDHLQRAEVPRLTEQYLQASERLVDLELDEGRYEVVIPRLQRITREHPLRERAWSQLMIALARSGRRAEALDAYRAVADHLRDNLGIDPGIELRNLHMELLTDGATAGGGVDTFRRRRVSTPRQLPADVPGFVGRAEALNILDMLISGDAPDSAVSAIVGTAGVGKTALAVHWAHRVADRFPGGQLYVNLRGFAPTPPMEPGEALAHFLRALGMHSEEIPPELCERAGLYRSLLAGHSVLVVLDNAVSAEQVRPLLPGESGCRVLVTSRNELRGLAVSHGASVLSLDVLSEVDARTLLGRLLGADRIAAAPEAADELARLCSFLPLALRIAAANLAAHTGLSIGDYLANLRAGNILDHLAADGDPETAVRATFDLSYAALVEPEQRMFRLLGVAPGVDISIPAAAAAAEVPVETAGRRLGQLATASLIERTSNGRFGCHDLLRRYAAELCGAEEGNAARHRLFDFYLRTAAAAAHLTRSLCRVAREPGHPGVQALEFADPAVAQEWLDNERDNLVAAAWSAADHGPQRYAWQLADSLQGYFYSHEHVMGVAISADVTDQTAGWRKAVEAGLASSLSESQPAAPGATRDSLRKLHDTFGSVPDLFSYRQEAVECFRRAGDQRGQAVCRNNLGVLFLENGEPHEAATQFREAAELAGGLELPGHEMMYRGNLGAVARHLGQLDEAFRILHESVHAMRDHGNHNAEAAFLICLGQVCHERGQLGQAVDYLTHASQLCHQLGNRLKEAASQAQLSLVHCDAGRYRAAEDHARSAHERARDMANRMRESEALISLGKISGCLKRDHEATFYYSAALHIARKIEYREAEARALIGSAETSQCLGDHGAAIDHATHAIEITKRTCLRVLYGQALTALANGHLHAGQPDEALTFAELALTIHHETGHGPGEARTQYLLGHIAQTRHGESAALPYWHAAHDLFTGMAMPEPADLAALNQGI